jgi:hypothetical protein
VPDVPSIVPAPCFDRRLPLHRCARRRRRRPGPEPVRWARLPRGRLLRRRRLRPAARRRPRRPDARLRLRGRRQHPATVRCHVHERGARCAADGPHAAPAARPVRGRFARRRDQGGRPPADDRGAGAVRWRVRPACRSADRSRHRSRRVSAVLHGLPTAADPVRLVAARRHARCHDHLAGESP